MLKIGVSLEEYRIPTEQRNVKTSDSTGQPFSDDTPMADELDVRIHTLPPMWVASAHVISTTPESDAWELLKAWAEPRGLMEDFHQHPVYGFNNPGPSPGQTTYGYEFWIRVNPDVRTEGKIRLQKFPGGSYAVITCEGFANPEIWMRFWNWVKKSPYIYRPTHELERAHNPLAPPEQMVFDLYLPVENKP